MKRVTTESGSVYYIDDIKKTWIRERGPDAALTRTDYGAFISRNPIRVGETFFLICPPLNPPFTRLITSTQVVSIEDVRGLSLMGDTNVQSKVSPKPAR